MTSVGGPFVFLQLWIWLATVALALAVESSLLLYVDALLVLWLAIPSKVPGCAVNREGMFREGDQEDRRGS